MSDLKRTVFAFCLALAASTSASAQTAPPDRLNVDASERHAPPRGSFVGGYSIDGSAGRWVVEFFNVYNEGGAPTFSARRALDAFDGQEQEQRTDMATCPAIWVVMEAMNNLPAPPVRVNNLRRSAGILPQAQHAPGPPSSDEAPNYTVWGRSIQGDGSHAQSKFSSNTGPIAAFVRFAEEQLAGCWAASSA